jgi:hypothetical protein
VGGEAGAAANVQGAVALANGIAGNALIAAAGVLLVVG